LKVYLVPYGVGESVGDPASLKRLVRYADGVERVAYRTECILWTGRT